MFTIITIAYWKLPFLKKTINSCLNQTYKDIELIIVNNGAFEDIIIYINKIAKLDKRVKIINYEENIFSWDDPELMSQVCLNAALKSAKGDYVFFTSYDDPMALDYVERMVRLFEDNPDCTSAAGRPVSIDANDSVNKEELNNRKTNFRSKYMPGHELALATLEHKSRVFGAPGTIFTFKRDVLLKYGGFHRAIELGHLYGIVPFGVTGFDEDAIYYWRRHEGQLHLAVTSRGQIGTKDVFSMIEDLDLENKWSIYGDDVARDVVKVIKNQQAKIAATWFSQNLFKLRISACIKIVRDIWSQPKFWFYLPKTIFRPWRLLRSLLRSFLISLFHINKPILKPILNYVDKKYPRLNGQSAIFNKLMLKVKE